MRRDRNAFLGEANMNAFYHPNMINPNMNPNFYPNPGGFPINQNSNPTYTSELDSRISRIERQLNRIETRVNKLEIGGSVNSYNTNEDTDVNISQSMRRFELIGVFFLFAAVISHGLISPSLDF